MKYEEALSLREANLNLIGTTTEQGNPIGAIVIAPTQQSSYEEFWRRYLASDLNATYAIAPFTGEDVCVMAIDTYHLHTDGVLFFKVVEE